MRKMKKSIYLPERSQNKTSKQFYKSLGVKRLDKRKENITSKEIIDLDKELDKTKRILDVGCGYGRIAIPLAKKGYYIEGIDITPDFIREAKKRARKEKLKIKFKTGDMTCLPYPSKSFDTIICLWSAFSELISEKDQLTAIKEMLRVIKKGGKVIIDLPIPFKRKDAIIKIGEDEFKIKNNQIILARIDKIQEMPLYMHDKETLELLMKNSKIKKFKIFIKNFGGRKRLFLEFWKE